MTNLDFFVFDKTYSKPNRKIFQSVRIDSDSTDSKYSYYCKASWSITTCYPLCDVCKWLMWIFHNILVSMTSCWYWTENSEKIFAFLINFVHHYLHTSSFETNHLVIQTNKYEKFQFINFIESITATFFSLPAGKVIYFIPLDIESIFWYMF